VVTVTEVTQLVRKINVLLGYFNRPLKSEADWTKEICLSHSIILLCYQTALMDFTRMIDFTTRICFILNLLYLLSQ